MFQTVFPKKVCPTLSAPELASIEDVVITRHQLLEKKQLIEAMEGRMAEQLNEFQYQKEKGDTFHSAQIREIHVEYCKALEDLKNVNNELEEKHQEKVAEFQQMMNEIKADNKKELEELELKLNEKVGYEFSRGQEIQANMNEMQAMYEEKLETLTNDFQGTIQTIESDSKNQLQERQSLLRDIMKELYDKKLEFTQYCSMVNKEHARKTSDSKINYETTIRKLRDESAENNIRTLVLEKQLLNVTVNCEELDKEKDVILNEHREGKKKINKFQIDAEQLREEIRDRDRMIQEREKRFNICEKRNQELEKQKDVLNFKIDYLNSETEPRNQQIVAKAAKIENLETEIENIFKHGMTLEQKLSDFNDKLKGCEASLEYERNKRRSAEAELKRICRDIYMVSRNIPDPKLLKQNVVKLHQK